MADVKSGQTAQLTRGQKSSTAPQWSPDGKWIALPRPPRRGQESALRDQPGGGEGDPDDEVRDRGLRVHLGAGLGSIAYSAAEPLTAGTERPQGAPRRLRSRAPRVPARPSVDDRAGRGDEGAGGRRQRTQGKDFSVGAFSWSPDGHAIAFSATINPDLINGSSSDIYTLVLADDRVKKIVSQPGSDTTPTGRPMAGRSSSRRRWEETVLREDLAARGGFRPRGTPRSLTDAFDEVPSVVAWNPAGLYFSAPEDGVALFRDRHGHRSDRASSAPDDLMGGGFTIDGDGRRWRSPPGLDEADRGLRVRRNGFAPRAADEHDRAGSRFIVGHARADLVEEPGRRRDRRRPDQAGRLRSVEEVPAALHHSRRSDRHRSAGAARRNALLPLGHLGGAAARWCSRSTIAAAPATARSSAASTSATSASAMPGTCSPASTT